MSRLHNVWNQLNQTFDVDVEVDIREAPYSTTRSTPNLDGDRDDYEGNHDQFTDFPYIEDPNAYQTYKAMEQKEDETLDEQEMPPPPAEAGAKAGVAAAPEGDDMGMGDAGADMGMGGDMGGMGDMGMGQEKEQTLTSSEIGKVYEMKKIYARLTSLESHLSATTDTSLLTMRGMVAQSMELFETVVVNFEQYKEQINEIIVTFYKFLDVTYEILRSYYKNDSKKEY